MSSRTYTPREWAAKQAADDKLWRELQAEAARIRRAALGLRAAHTRARLSTIH